MLENPPIANLRSVTGNYKMKQTTLFILTLFILTFDCKAHNNDCIEVKYLDFFGIADFDTIKWPDNELNQLLKRDFTKNEKDKELKTNFLIPMIVLQLKGFHPTCEKLSDTTQYSKLIQLYFNIRQKDKSVINGKTLPQQLEFIRQDYYDQVLNDTLLPFMNYTLDDGPLFGQLSKYIPKLDNGKYIETDFGKLTIVKSNEKIHLIATDNKQRVMWTRVMTGTSERVLTDLHFGENPVFKTSRAYIIAMSSEGERLTLYLKLDGNFMYYYHSW